MLNATVKYEVLPQDTPAQVKSIIAAFQGIIPDGKVFNNVKVTINADGSITSFNPINPGQSSIIDKSKITKEGDYTYIITSSTPEMSGAKEIDVYTFNADGTGATINSRLEMSVNNITYQIYFYKDGTLTKQ